MDSSLLLLGDQIRAERSAPNDAATISVRPADLVGRLDDSRIGVGRVVVEEQQVTGSLPAAQGGELRHHVVVGMNAVEKGDMHVRKRDLLQLRPRVAATEQNV